MIAAGDGYNDSVKIRQLYMDWHATKEDYTTSKEDYTKALQAHQTYQIYLCEIGSEQRDKAAAFSDECRYFE